MKITELPRPILSTIFCYLPSRSTCNISKVCTLFYRIIFDATSTNYRKFLTQICVVEIIHPLIPINNWKHLDLEKDEQLFLDIFSSNVPEIQDLLDLRKYQKESLYIGLCNKIIRIQSDIVTALGKINYERISPQQKVDWAKAKGYYIC